MATSVIPTALEPWVQVLVPQPCFDIFFIDLNFLNALCLKLVLSKCLGFGIILGSVMVKLPQIVKIMNAGSAEGISLVGVLLELAAISATAAYGFAKSFPFSTYGEALFLVIQTAAIVFLVLYYSGRGQGALVFVGVYCALMAYLMSPLVPLGLLTTIQGFNILIVLASKLIQVNANYQNGSTGQLSAFTVTMLFLGSIARIFTSVQETPDPLILITYAVAASCNGLIVAQIIYYWNTPQKQKDL